VGAYDLIELSAEGPSAFQAVTRPPGTLGLAPSQGSFVLALTAKVSAGATLNYSVQVTSDPFPSNTGNWVDHAILSQQTASATSNLAYGVTAYRLVINSYSSGSVVLGASWW
jgi:hypothetical protein